MHSTTSRSLRSGRRGLLTLGVLTASTAMLLSACGGSDDAKSGSSGSASAGAKDNGKKVGVSLITKDSSNPFFVAMQKGAKEYATKAGNIDLTIASGKQEGDDAGQIQAIENAVVKGDKGILITPMSNGVNAAMTKARESGLYVIALDTPPDPANTVDITFATDNFKAGTLIGQWAEKQLNGKPATIALLDLFNDKIVSVDYNRDQGFLTGMGIDTKDKKKNGDEAKTGKYKSGTYTIACNEAGNGAEDGGRTAMEQCLTKNPDINVIYTINEPTAVGAYAALKAAGKEKNALIVSVDGGCAGVNSVKDGVIGATAQQYPLKMAELGVSAISKISSSGEKPKTSEGLDFFDTGVALVSDKKADGVDSITSDEGSKICWGGQS